ncbi:class I SAM-dependent methyltransferase [Shigella flexneri]
MVSIVSGSVSTIDCSGVRRRQPVLNLAGGTGDLTAKILPRMVGETGRVMADINDSMLKMGREKLVTFGVVGNVEYTVQANAEALPFPDGAGSTASPISFGLRNVTDKTKRCARCIAY